VERRRALVTGASQGIGRAVATALLEAGFEVLGTSRRPAEIADPPDGVRFLALDLMRAVSIDACLAEAGSLDVLVSNAGGSSVWAAAEAPEERLRAIVQLDFFGPVRLIRGVLPSMLERGSGFILNIGSLVWRFGLPFQSGYAAAKAALAAFSWSLRNEVRGRGVRVAVVDPGDIRTTIEPSVVPPVDPAFRAAYAAFFRARNAGMAKAQPPEVVAAKVLALLRMKRPPAFSTAGKGSKTQAALRRLLPDSVIERQVRKKYGL
jgi:NAD(P)-dependent dehydrogenase (short-subunit alcohol dehydrogenase family)